MASQIAGLYDMENTLGSGHFAVVKSARHVFTGLRVAIKVIDKLKLDEVSRTHLYQEVRCMKLVTHPSIIRLYEVIDTQTKLYLIQELGDGGDLYDFIMKHPSGVDEDLARRIFKQTVSAIRYCHQLHVVHRDLKPENLVFCTANQLGQPTTPRVKLTDFGLSRTFLPGELIESSCGSLEYSAPEILLGDSYDPPKIDVWSLGVILFMLIAGRSPFAYGGAGEILARIMDGKYHCPPHVSDQCRSLIGTMLVVDSQRRASLEEVANNKWLQEGEEEEPVPLPAIGNIDEITKPELEVILRRMEQGGYGTMEAILKLIKEKPYGSTAATFYLLAEAERHRKFSRSQQTTPPMVARKGLSPAHVGATTPNRPLLPGAFGIRSHGSAESGFLQWNATSIYFTPNNTQDRFVHLRRMSVEPTLSSDETSPLRKYASPSLSSGLGEASNHTSPQQTTPYTPLYQPFASPRAGVAGEQRSLIQTPKPAFPLNVQTTIDEELMLRQSAPILAPLQLPAHSVPIENIDYSPYIIRQRALSVFEEESETESVSDFTQQGAPHRTSPGPSGTSPMHTHSNSRRLSNARSSPHLFGSISKSDISDDEEDEEDDDIVELMTTSGRFPNKGATFPRTSPGNSPLLTSRRSPTHYLTGSSDEEFSNVFEARSKRMFHRKRRSIPNKLVPMDSISSDDGINQRDVVKRPARKDRLGLRPYNSLPATPAENSGSESLVDLLDSLRRNRSGSCRTDSSLSDGGGGSGDKDMKNLAKSMVSKFELSDEDSVQVAMETDVGSENGGGSELKRTRSTTLRSVFCNIL